MLHLLEPSDYERVRPLYAGWRSYLAVFAVIEGRCPGQIYADDPEDPRTALLWDHVEGELYLVGGAGDAGGEGGASPADATSLGRALNFCLRHRIRPYAEANLSYLSEYTLFCDPASWGDTFDGVLEGMNPMEHRRTLYWFQEPRVAWRARMRTLVGEGYALTPLGEALFSRGDLGGMDEMADWVLGDWRSPAVFGNAPKAGASELGYCLSRGDELVSWCATEYICEPVPGEGKACHLGIYTRAPYRRQGFAALVAAATVERCLAAGIRDIGWHCWASNLGSAATAVKVGFSLLRDQIVYNGCWNPFDNLLLQAHYQDQAGRTREAVARWERAFAMWEAGDPEALAAPHCRDHPGTLAWCYTAAARARAAWGDTELALAHLHKSVDHGWRQEWGEDEGFSALHDTPGWARLLARMRD